MSLNPGGTNYNWNYSRPDKPGYSTLLVGTVLAIQEVQKMGYTMNGQPGAPEFWPDGNPKMNIRLALATPEGALKTFTFQPAGKEQRAGRKASIHMDLWHLTDDTDMLNLIGKTIAIKTQEGQYGQGNPRPWSVGFAQGGPYELSMPLPAEFKVPQVLANSAVSGGHVMPQAQQQPQVQYQSQQVPPYYQHTQQVQYQPVQTSQTIDPSVLAAMQQMGATNIQEVGQNPGGPVYGQPYGDNEVPF